VGASLLKRVGISGLIGAGIGLAYIPCSITVIVLTIAFELDPFVANIVALPLVLPVAIVGEIGLPAVVEVPLLVASLATVPAVGAGIGAGVHWTRNLVKKTRASRG
jgi:hypothetical protein